MQESRAQREISVRIVTLLVTMGGVIGGFLFVVPGAFSRPAMVMGYLGVSLMILPIIATYLLWYRRCCNDEGKRHTTTVYLYAALFAFLGIYVVTLNILGYLFMQQQAIGYASGSFVAATACLVLLWRVTRSLLRLGDRSEENISAGQVEPKILWSKATPLLFLTGTILLGAGTAIYFGIRQAYGIALMCLLLVIFCATGMLKIAESFGRKHRN